MLKGSTFHSLYNHIDRPCFVLEPFCQGHTIQSLKKCKDNMFSLLFFKRSCFTKSLHFAQKKFNDFLPNIKTMTMNNNEYSWDTKGFQTWQHGFTVRNKKKIKCLLSNVSIKTNWLTLTKQVPVYWEWLRRAIIGQDLSNK